MIGKSRNNFYWRADEAMDCVYAISRTMCRLFLLVLLAYLSNVLKNKFTIIIFNDLTVLAALRRFPFDRLTGCCVLA